MQHLQTILVIFADKSCILCISRQFHSLTKVYETKIEPRWKSITSIPGLIKLCKPGWEKCWHFLDLSPCWLADISIQDFSHSGDKIFTQSRIVLKVRIYCWKVMTWGAGSGTFHKLGPVSLCFVNNPLQLPEHKIFIRKSFKVSQQILIF